MKLLHENASASTLAFARIWVFGIWLIKIAADPLALLADMPRSIFDPPGVLNLIPASAWNWLLQPVALNGLRITSVVVLSLAVLGIRTRITIAVGCLLMIYYQGLIRGFGFVNHAELPLLYAAIILALFPNQRAARFSPRLAGGFVRPRIASNSCQAPALACSLPMILMVLGICLMICFMGTHRLVYGRLGVFTSDTFLYYVLQRASESRYYDWNLGFVLTEQRWLYELLRAGFVGITLLEFLAPLALVSKPFRYLFIAGMLLFHLVTWLMMDIFFWELCLLYVLFFDFNPRSATRPSGSVFSEPRP